MIKRSIKDLSSRGNSYPSFVPSFCHSISDTLMPTVADVARRSEKIDPSEIFMICAVCTARGVPPKPNRVFFRL